MATVYCTSEMVTRNRFQFWRNLMCQNFVPAHGSTDDNDTFDARFTVSNLGSMTVFGMSAPFQCWERSSQHVRRAPHDEFLLTLMLSGSGSLRQGGREAIQGPGVMSLYDTNKPYSYELSGETLAVKIPRHLLLSRIATPIELAVAMSSDSPVGALASSVIRQAAAFDIPAEAPSAALIGSSILDIVAALLNNETYDEALHETSDSSSLLERIRRYVIAHLGDTTLTVESISRAHDVSARTLNRLFATIGTTPMRWVWQERLAASHRALQETPRKRVTDIAFAHGFSELSHFSRAFKNEYGHPPHRLSA